MLRLARASLRARRLTLAGCLVALVLGVALTTGAAVFLESAARYGAGAPSRVDATSVIVRAPAPRLPLGLQGVVEPSRPALNAALVDRLAAVPGAARAVGDLAFRIQPFAADGPLLGRDGAPVWGHAWDGAALTPFALAAGRPPLAADDVVLDAGLARHW